MANGAKPAGAQPTASDSLVALLQPKYGTALSGATVDALFAPLPTIETRGRLWLYIDQQIKPAKRGIEVKIWAPIGGDA